MGDHAQLDIIGIGANGVRDITLQGHACLRLAECIYVIAPAPDLATYFAELKAEIVPLWSHHQRSRNPGKVYRAIADQVFEESTCRSRSVLIVSGNPWLLAASVQMLLSRSCSKLKVIVHAGISCIDQIPALLGRDLVLQGLQIVDTTRMMLNEIGLSPEMESLLLQPAGYHSSTYLDPGDLTPATYKPLVNYLRRYYKSAHPIYIVEAGTPGSFFETTIEELPESAHRISYSASLLIPPAKRSRSGNLSFAVEYFGLGWTPQDGQFDSPRHHDYSKLDERESYASPPTRLGRAAVLLLGPRLILHEQSLDDVENVHALLSNPQTMLHLPHLARTNGWSVVDAEQRIRTSLLDRLSGNSLHFVVEDRETQKFVGTCAYTSINYGLHSGTFGLMLRNEYWGRRFGIEIMLLVWQFGFEELGLNRIQYQTAISNDRIHAISSRLGIEREGVAREYYPSADGNKDAALYAVCRSEWTTIRDRMIASLRSRALNESGAFSP